ncbi:MAG: hypothetical protein IJ215_01360 [Clostridia bacterium]|nr:hypothetical protein [Clostridia bacterium]
MPSCLGIYTDKNVIKYAKITSVSDKVRSQLVLDAYGVKFYDNIQTAVEEIARELECENVPVALTLSNEDYYMTEVFNNLKKKDMLDLASAEYVERRGGVSSSVLEFRVKLANNYRNPDKRLALCVASSKGELANIRTNFDAYKIDSISPLPVSIKNLFENQGVDEEAAIINIEDKTTITVFHRNEMQLIGSIPLGASEIISKLAERYNSRPKAYDACKRVSAYLEDSYDMDDETREILDVIIPTLYDIRQQSEDILLPYLKDIKKIYITGTGAVINNVDLYFHEVFIEPECEVLKPFFISNDNSNAKDIIEVNSAIALALDGLGMADVDLNFNAASKKAAGTAAAKDTMRKVKEIGNAIKGKITDTVTYLNSPTGSKRKRSRKKRNISFDEGVKVTKEKEPEVEVEMIPGFGRLDVWLRVACAFSLALFIVYAVCSHFVSNAILAKETEAQKEISQVEAAIASANDDATYLRGQADQYSLITQKLEAVIDKIKNKQTNKTFDIPNFLSKLMFIIPANVRVTNIVVDESGEVTIDAESGQYAQLGYFVSRIKLERALLNVDMEVVSVNSDIKIIISGVLP